ncbi:asparaginase [Paenibacillus yanchengensis]|uniref:Asparaginase n=1 Tax=Paenibacillus yanchengensis TaxID=2035833 RepID=A0ABW4YQU4_9BACL
MMTDQLSTSEKLIEEWRGNMVECEYWGHVCVISDTGQVQYAVGDPHYRTYLRSSAKPIQAIPSFVHGVGDKFGWTGKEQAITTASHRSEAFHVDVLQSMLDKLGINESDLICHSTYPLNVAARDVLVKEGKPERRLYHNCSGKHLGMLGLCLDKGYPLQGYDQIDHPAQQEVLATLAMMAEYPQEDIGIAIDGCGLPVFALPLSHLAKAYLKMACPDVIEDSNTRAAVEKMTKLMNEHYEMVAGTNMICSALLRDDNLVAKGGAKGVYAIGLRHERMAIALKVMDGSEEKWPMIVASILEQIGYEGTDTIERLYQLCPKQFMNGNDTIVGENRPVFTLEASV